MSYGGTAFLTEDALRRGARAAKSVLHCPEDAEDAVMEAAVRYCRAAGRAEIQNPEHLWAVCVRAASVSIYRKVRKRRAKEVAMPDMTTLGLRHFHHDGGIGSAIERMERQRLAGEAGETLGQILGGFEIGLTTVELGTSLGLTDSGIRSRLLRWRRKLDADIGRPA